jgi:hypothetical protein
LVSRNGRKGRTNGLLQRRRKEEEMGGEEMVASEWERDYYKLNEYNIKR